MKLPEKYTSPDGTITLAVEDVGGGDLAIGFQGFSWHTHADILASLYGLPEADAVRAYVDAILSDESIIAILSVDGIVSDVWITDDPSSETKYMQPNETIQFRYWSGQQYVIA